MLANIEIEEDCRPIAMPLPIPEVQVLRSRPEVDIDHAEIAPNQVQASRMILPLSQLIENHTKDVAMAVVEFERDKIQTIVNFLDQSLKERLTITEERNRVLAILSRITSSTLIFPQRYELRGIKTPTKKFDIWSLGCLFYEVLSRKPPYYQYKSEVQIIAALTRKEMPKRPGSIDDNDAQKDEYDWDDDIEEDYDAIDDQAWSLIIKCCAPEPEARPDIANVQELVVDMKIQEDRPAVKDAPGADILKSRVNPKINLTLVEELFDRVKEKLASRAKNESPDFVDRHSTFVVHLWAVVFARSAMAGCQRFPVHWGGDPMSTSGFGYWAHDIGGFEGKPDPGLYKGWFAFGSLSSHSRLHGSGSYRVPWIIDTSGSCDPILRHFISLKLSLMPYLYGAAISTHRTGTPMMRPLFFEFPEDRTSWTIDEAYMLGVNLYVAPVFSDSDLDPMGSGGYSPAGSSFAPEASGKKTEAEGRQSTTNEKASVQVYIPPGDWFSLLTGQFLTGALWSIQHHTYDFLPLLLCPGCAIALSGSVPIDFYFNENSAWKLRDLDQTKIEERAWSSDGEWKSRGGEYNCLRRVTVVINASRCGSEALDLKLVVLDSRDDRLGGSCAELHVWEKEKGKICVEVVNGELKGQWKVVCVDKEAGVAQTVASPNQKPKVGNENDADIQGHSSFVGYAL
ncbi:Alpha-xylosidase [Leucoagaricus sp. SymC.cos]|nr:Alpha-xylosidase [Leucoagaricus sp. SymC.cos]